MADELKCEGTFSSIFAVHHCLPSGLQIVQCSCLCVLLHRFSSLLDVPFGLLPLVFSELRIMTWPMISQDAAVCKERLKLVGELLQECLPPVQKFDQLAILMEKFEVDDWATMEDAWYAKQAKLKPEERWVGPGHRDYKLPGPAVVVNFAAPGAASCATQAALLSTGSSAVVAPPQAAAITLNSASAAMVEASKQQALAKAAHAQAAIQEQLQRDLALFG